jgi:hypothetical protein
VADNVTLNAGTGGATLATDDVGGVHYQIVKQAFGALDSATLVSTSNPFPISDAGGSLTVDGTVGISGTVTVDSELTTADVDTGAGTDTRAVVGLVLAASGGGLLVGSANPMPVSDNSGSLTVDNAGTFAVQATQSGNWSARTQDGSGNAITSATRGAERALTVQIVDASGTQVTSFSGSGTASAVSTANSTTATLTAASVFTGTSEDISAYASVTIAVFADQASATDGLQLQQSSNGSNWDIVDSYTIPASTGKTFGVQVTAKFFRVVYTNGGTNQGAFRLQTIYHAIMLNASSVRPQDARTNENDMQEVISYCAGYNGTTWDRLRATTANGLAVDVTRVQGTVAVTQSGSWALTANQSVNVAQINGVTPLMGAGATGTGSHRVTIATDGQGQVADNAGFTDTATRLDMAGYIFDEVAGTALTENDGAAARIDSKRAQVLVLEDATTRGQRQAVSAAGAASINLAQVNGNTALAGNGVTGTGSPRVTIASDNTAFAVNAQITPVTSGGLSTAAGSIAATVTSVKASAGQLYGWYIYNPNASVAYVQIFDLATGSVTLGTTTPKMSLGIPAGSAANIELSNGIAFATAISIAITTTRAGSTGPGSTVDYNMAYK